jgi:hypothetical protein
MEFFVHSQKNSAVTRGVHLPHLKSGGMKHIHAQAFLENPTEASPCMENPVIQTYQEWAGEQVVHVFQQVNIGSWPYVTIGMG